MKKKSGTIKPKMKKTAVSAATKNGSSATPKKTTVKIPPMKILAPKKDSMFINNTFLAAAGLIIVIIFVAILATKADKNAQSNQAAGNSNVRSGQQIAKINILPADGSNPAQSGAGSQMGEMNLSDSLPAGNHVKFRIDHFEKLALQPLKFNLYDDKGKELTPDLLQTVHEKKIHLIIVSANLREYQHLHPNYFNGVWNVNAKLPNVGTYYAYADFSPIKGAAGIYRSKLVVKAETTGQINYPGTTPDAVAIIDGYKVRMSANALIANQSNKLSFSITKDGKVVTNLKPYLGAWGHVVVMRQGDPISYMHLHSATTTDETVSTVDFVATFPAAGKYTAFAEFSFGGKIVLFPVTFVVQ